MRRAAALPRPSRAPSGFTLLEMLVVLAITGLITGLLYPQISAASVSVRQRLAREQLAAAAEAARAMTMRSGVPVTLSADQAGTALVIAGSRRIALDPAGGLRVIVRPQNIVFYPDGSTTGGDLLLGTGQMASAFSISRAGGRLQAAPTAGESGV